MPHKTRTAPPAIDVGSEDYNRIMAGLEEARGIIEGSAPANSYRQHKVRVPEAVDVKHIRTRMKLTQEAFASRYGFSAGAVRDWEQGRKTPERSNRLLLTIIERRPEVIDELLA